MRLRIGGVCSVVTSSTAVAGADTELGMPGDASSILRFSKALLDEVIGVRGGGIPMLLGQISFTTNLFDFVASSSFDINFPVSKSMAGRA